MVREVSRDVWPVEIGERLRYRSQFVLGPRFVEDLPAWSRVELGHGLRLSAHPDLPVTRVVDGPRAITLLGYMLDPFQPAATDADLVRDLLATLAAAGDLVEQTGRYGGRWILIVDDGSSRRLFHDAIGMRQVYYTDVARTGEVWCASQPGIVAGLLQLPVSEEALALLAAYPRPDGEHRLPVALSSHTGMKRLMPNHYLDLASGTSERYWPVRSLEPITLTDCVERSAGILEGLMESAARRFPLAISITAGRDSRLVLAAARRIATKVSYVTVAKPKLPASDIEVPARLLGRLGLQHEIIPWPARVDEEFTRIFMQNVTLPHELYVPESYAVFSYNRLTKVAVTGSAGELARPRWRPSRIGADGNLTAEKLTKTAKFGDAGLVIDAFRGWLPGVPRFKNPDVMRLYRWECGSWLTLAQLEFDAAWKDILTPFNNRLLLTTMLSLDERLRCGPRFPFFEDLMRRLWPDVLIEPFPEVKLRFFLSPARISRIVRQLREGMPFPRPD